MMTKIVVETCSITILVKHKLYIKKCCVVGYNINNLIFYTQQDVIYKVNKLTFSPTMEPSPLYI
jgi:hypothetical protein